MPRLRHTNMHTDDPHRINFEKPGVRPALAWFKISIVKKRFKKNVVRLIQIMYQLHAVNDNGHVSKKLWTFIKSQRKDHCGVAPLKYNSKIHDDITMKIEILKFFT